jgi:formate hydrogenlyase subunit 3/multisubunit Na+/H+ antiporter MnhD subunit
VLYSTVQNDMKRLLAYSSIENIGLIAVGIGLTLSSMPTAWQPGGAGADRGALPLPGHSAFKSLLFLCTGSVLHATGERNLGKLGGLIHRMPWVAWLALAGVIASAGLPPLSGFVSEWLLLQSFLFSGPAAPLAQHGGAGGGRAGGCRRAGRLRHGQVLRHHLPRPDARARAQGRTMPAAGKRSASSGWR